MTTSSLPCLDGLPVEVTKLLVSYLDLIDLCSLRLVSLELAAKSSQGQFKSYFRHKKIDFDNLQQLEDFQRVTQPNGMGCLPKELSILRLASTFPNGSTDSNLAILTNCFKNLKLNSTHGCLPGLSLEIWSTDDDGKLIPPDREHWQTTWSLAGFLYRDVMAALQETGIPIKRLTIFGSSIDCSLACHQLHSNLEMISPSDSLLNLECLTLGLSHSMTWTKDNEFLATAEERHDRIETFLNLCRNIKSLDLHWFNIWSGGDRKSEQLSQERRVFDRIATSISFPRLEELTLRGLKCTGSILQNFLETHPQLRHLDLNNIRLAKDEKWRPIFDWIKRKSNLEFIHFDCLFEDGIISFPKMPGEAYLPRAGRNWPNEMTRRGTEISERHTTRSFAVGPKPRRTIGTFLRNNTSYMGPWIRTSHGDGGWVLSDELSTTGSQNIQHHCEE